MDFSKMSDAQLKAALEESRREVAKLDKKKDPSPYAHMSDEELKAALHQSRQELDHSTRKPKKSSSFDAHRTANQFAHNMNVGIAKLADLPFQAYEGLRTGMIKGAHHLAPNHVPDTHYGEGYLPNLAERYDKFMDPHGTLAPQTKGQHALKDISESVGTLPALGVLGGAMSLVKQVPRVAKMVTAYGPAFVQKAPRVATAAKALMGMGAPTASNIAATVGAPAAMHAHRNVVKNPTAGGEMASGVAGGMAASLTAPGLLKAAMGIPNVVKNPELLKDSFADMIGKLAKHNVPSYEQQIKIGARPTLGSSADRQLIQKAELSMRESPITEYLFEPIDEANKKTFMRNLGVNNPEASPQVTLAKKGADALKTRKSAEYKKLNAKFAPTDQKLLDSYADVDVADILEDLAPSRRGLKSPSELEEYYKTLPGQFHKSLSTKVKERAADTTDIKKLKKQGYTDEFIEKFIKPPAVEGAQNISYGGLNQEREKALHLAQTIDPEVDANARREARRLYDMLAGKKHEAIEAVATPEAKAASQEAKKQWADYANENTGLQDYVYKIEKKPDDVSAFNTLKTSDPRFLRTAREGLNKREHRHLLESYMNHTSRDNTGAFSLFKAHSNWVDPQMAETNKELLKLFPKPKDVENFKGTMNLMGEKKGMLQKIANTSKSAYWLEWLKFFSKHGASLSAAVLTGNPTPLVGTLVYDAAKWGGGKLMTDPIFLARVNKMAHARSQIAQKNHIENLLKYPPVKKALLESARATAQSEVMHTEKDNKKR